MKKLAVILRWVFGVAIIVLGILVLFANAILTGTLWIVCGLLMLPPITQRIPPFPRRKAILSIGCIVLFFGATLVVGDQNLSVPSQNEGVVEEKLSQESIQPTSSMDAATLPQESVQPVPSIDAATLSTRMQEALSNRETTPDSVKEWRASVPEDEFFTAWKKGVAEGLSEQDLSQLSDVASYLDHAKDVYGYAYQEITSSQMKDIVGLMDELCGDVEEMEILQSQTSADLQKAAVSYGVQEMYIVQRLNSTTSSEVLDALKDIWDAVATEEEDSSEWVAYNVEYFYGNALPGDQVKIVHANSLNPFSQQRAWTISCYDTGETREIQNANGFTQTVPVYQMIENAAEFEEILYAYRSI